MTIENVFQFKYESASVTIRERPEEKSATVHSLFSKERRKGHASVLMSLVTIYADDKDVSLILSVGRYGHPIGPDNSTLIEFYKDYGFVVTHSDGPIIMERPSQKLHGL